MISSQEVNFVAFHIDIDDKVLKEAQTVAKAVNNEETENQLELMFSSVKKFYPKAQIVDDRSEIAKQNGRVFDNFVVVNNRGDIWCELSVVEKHIASYVKSMKPGCLFFYSFRDTQIVDWNRLKQDHTEYFYNFAIDIEKKYNLNLLWHDIKFAIKEKDGAGNYDIWENPDTTNGNIKYVFQYKTKTKKIVHD